MAITGIVSCRVAEGTPREVDLGFRKLEQGATGTELGAVLQKIEGGEERQEIELNVDVASEKNRSIMMKEASGRETPFKISGHSSSGDRCTLYCSVPPGIPAEGRIIATLFHTLRQVDVPFELTNVDLLGCPRG